MSLLYTGDIGTVDDVDPNAGEIAVSFDGRSVKYGFGELDMLVPAYAATIHKSQGSEYPAVIVPVLTQHYAMLQRNLLYTGVTRGKRLVVWVCLGPFRRAIQRVVLTVIHCAPLEYGQGESPRAGHMRLATDSLLPGSKFSTTVKPSVIPARSPCHSRIALKPVANWLRRSRHIRISTR
jgi:hypothetical protein